AISTGETNDQKKTPGGGGKAAPADTRCGRPGPARSGGPLQQAALLVFLPGAARAWVVASHLLAVGGAGLGPRDGGRARGRAVLTAPGLPPVRGPLSDPRGGRLLLGHAHLEELLDRGLL